MLGDTRPSAAAQHVRNTITKLWTWNIQAMKTEVTTRNIFYRNTNTEHRQSEQVKEVVVLVM